MSMHAQPSEHAGRVAVVTGGSGGIGLPLVRRLQEHGAIVYNLDAVAPPGDGAAAGRLPEGQLVDVSDEHAVDAAIDAIAAREGRLDYLVCCAAVFPARPFLELSPDVWQRTLRVNLTGSFLACRAALRHMEPARFGRIVLLSSLVARTAGVNCAHYAASKGGVLGLARSLALEVADANVRVNTVSPGVTDTPQPRGHLSEEALYARAATIPLGRIGQPADVVEACLFLLSEDSSFFTGQDLRVAGGAALW